MTWSRRPKADEAFTLFLLLEVDATTQSPSILQFIVSKKKKRRFQILRSISEIKIYFLRSEIA